MLTHKNVIFDNAICVIFDWHFCKLSTTVIVEGILSEAVSYVSHHQGRQASINARALVWYPI